MIYRWVWWVALGLILAGCGAEASPEFVPLAASPTSALALPTAAPSVSPTFELLPTVTLAPTRTPFPTAPQGSQPTSPVLPTFTPAPVTQTATFEISTEALDIEYFTSDSNDSVANGDSLTLFWRVVGATEAQIFQLTAEGRRAQVWRVAPEGAISVRVRAADNDVVARFVIQVEFRGTTVEDSLEIPLLDCEGEWFFSPAPSACPSQVAQPTGQVEQEFENGRMIWLESRQTIYVLSSDQIWDSFPDTYTADQPERDDNLAPPPERLQPIRGFGLVWRENPEVQQRLGWAIAPEFGYDGIIQQAGGDAETIYLRISGGGIVALQADQTWELLPSTNIVPTSIPTDTSNTPTP